MWLQENPASEEAGYSRSRSQGSHNTSSERLEAKRPRDPQTQRRVNSRDPIIRHDSQAAGERFGLPRGERLPNIEDTKKYKAQQQIFPVGWNQRTASPEWMVDPMHSRINQVFNPRINRRYRVPWPKATEEQSKMLSRNFVDDNLLWIFSAPIHCGSMSTPNADQPNSNCQNNLKYD